ncbi:MAG: hypothetical protein KAT70_09775, partial [Thermoplasmata archaeon]|nr:hypothetical protein [Thermoplasmata archaeon]
VSGPVAGAQDVVLVDGELRNVTYHQGEDNIEQESVVTTISADWDQTRTAFVFTISKDAIGSPQPEEYLTHLWAAVWNDTNDPYGEERFLVDALDVAMNYSIPGQNFMFLGGLEETYSVSVKGPSGKLEIGSNQTANATITVKVETSRADNFTFNVTLTTSHNSSGSATLDVTTLSFNASGQSEKVMLNFTAPTVENETNVTVTVMAELAIEEGGVTSIFSSQCNITFVVAPAGAAASDTDGEGLMGFLMSPMVLGAIGGILILVVVGAVVRKRKRSSKSKGKKAPAAMPVHSSVATVRPVKEVSERGR